MDITNVPKSLQFIWKGCIKYQSCFIHSSEDFRVVSEGWATVPKCFRNIQTVSDSVIIASYAVSEFVLVCFRQFFISESFSPVSFEVSDGFRKFQNISDYVTVVSYEVSECFGKFHRFSECLQSSFLRKNKIERIVCCIGHFRGDEDIRIDYAGCLKLFTLFYCLSLGSGFRV